MTAQRSTRARRGDVPIDNDMAAVLQGDIEASEARMRLSELKLSEPVNNGPWGDYDFEKPSRSVVVTGEFGMCVLWTVGGHVRMDIEESCLGAEDMFPRPPGGGLWVWEGRHVWIPGSWECEQDGSLELEGLFRRPSDDEYAAVLAGRCPWNDDEWKAQTGVETGGHVSDLWDALGVSEEST